MAQSDLRTYRRRSTTRESGYHVCDEYTGGECIISFSERLAIGNKAYVLSFNRPSATIPALFGKNIGILAFGGYVKPSSDCIAHIKISYSYGSESYSKETARDVELFKNEWKNIGLHDEVEIKTNDTVVKNIKVVVTFESDKEIEYIDFCCFDLDGISKEEFLNDTCAESFYQKTFMHVPYLYYLRTDRSLVDFVDGINPTKGSRIILKSCNRCGRFLPINEDNELKTLSFSLHCKKKAPCTHATFSSYKIMNLDDLSKEDMNGLAIRDGDKLISYYGHQLECKACKKFFVNAPLNPQRNAQQFKEDGLRRRAVEVLVNKLLGRNLVHFEFENKTKKEFSKYIWEKFNKRCFKCGENSKELELSEMALDHTMPLAYLYRLDETATCLCSSHNSQKSDHFPVDYYTESELQRLSKITGLSLETLHSKQINKEVLDLLIKDVVWYFDVFLMEPDYQKVRDGIKTANKINDSLKRVSAGKVDLAEEYKKKTGHYPKSVSIL